MGRKKQSEKVEGRGKGKNVPAVSARPAMPVMARHMNAKHQSIIVQSSGGQAPWKSCKGFPALIIEDFPHRYAA